MRKIEVIIAPDGTPQIEGKGFAGADCLKATKYLEEALGVTTKDVRTKEFYQKASQKNQQQASQ